MRVQYQTFGCKANQYDTERIRQEVEARGFPTVDPQGDPDVVVVNSCTVTSQADADARRYARRVQRRHPQAKVVMAGCSAALHGERYRALPSISSVVPGHDPVAVAGAVAQAMDGGGPPLVQLGTSVQLQHMDLEPVAGEILTRRTGGTRGWLKVQDGCDRKCAFCATRLARGASRSRPEEMVVTEARALARFHPELVITGIHIGHYGRDLTEPSSLSRLVARLLDEVPDVRFRLGSIEATEVDDLLLRLLSDSRRRLVPHLHMPLQSGADPVLKAMRRWHTREMYRDRALEVAESLGVGAGGALGMGADIITGFPGETDAHHEDTVRLVEELPFTYLHVFPFSPREGTPAAELAQENPVPQRVAAERAKELREVGVGKGESYLASRVGSRVEVVVERERPDGTALGLTEDYLRLPVEGSRRGEGPRLWPGTIERAGDRFFVTAGSAQGGFW
ncbi:MAG: MiaB/RimO family radical SAM methylthiotransferase [Gemmatimonadota bacterium]